MTDDARIRHCGALRESSHVVAAPQLSELVRILTDPDILAGKHLPQEEREEYRRCQQSVIDARNYAQAHAYEWYVN